MPNFIADPQIWASLATLTAMEIVLGIDNLVFIAVVAGRLPLARQAQARQIGLALALAIRLLLLGAVVWIVGLTQPIFEFAGHAVSWRDLILVGGGLFLLFQGTREIHAQIEGDASVPATGTAQTYTGIIVQIVLLDIVFSLDSVITAVGMANQYWVMASGVVIAMLLMIAGSGPVANFINRHPTIKMLALSFLLLVGFTLLAEGMSFEIPKGYIYAAIGFSTLVEGLNQLMARRKSVIGRRS
jgi:predicted tellurium resistance membrane protein TerC